MNLFWYEFIHFVAYIFSVLVSIASVALFLWTVRKEGVLRTKWRPLGFFFLSAACFLFILERKFDNIGIVALLMEILGFYFIYKGVLVETDLSHLQNVGKNKTAKTSKAPQQKKWKWGFDHTYIYLAVYILLTIPVAIFLRSFLNSFIALGSLIFITFTIRIQIRRYQSGGKAKNTKRQNLYPLVGYIFLFIREIFYILYRLPQLDIVDLRQLTTDYGFVWIAGLVLALLGFIFLAIWAWNYIKLRVFLRTYTVLLTIVILIATIGSLINALLLFRIVEEDNLNLMSKGARTEKTVMDDRANVATAFAATFANNQELITALKKDDYKNLNNVTDELYETSKVDTLKIYHSDGDIVASPSDQRELGQNYANDNLFKKVINSKEKTSSFYPQEGVLSPLIVTRALSPIIEDDNLLGIVEVSYVFDNAFVDFSKEKTKLDVTIYSDSTRSATTIQSEDEVSRWVGSKESNEEVIEEVLNNRKHYATEVDRLGIMYYSAFEPIRNNDNEIIGMVSVGVPTEVLLENSRQELLSSFLIVSGISILIAMAGYEILKRYSIPE